MSKDKLEDKNGSEDSYHEEGGIRIRIENGKYVKPKRSLTAYNIFFQKERQKMIDTIQKQDENSKNPQQNIGFATMGKKVAQKWKNIDEKVHRFYLNLAEQDKIRYKREITLWRKLDRSMEETKTKAAVQESITAANRLAQEQHQAYGPQQQHIKTVAVDKSQNEDNSGRLRNNECRHGTAHINNPLSLSPGNMTSSSEGTIVTPSPGQNLRNEPGSVRGFAQNLTSPVTPEKVPDPLACSISTASSAVTIKAPFTSDMAFAFEEPSILSKKRSQLSLMIQQACFLAASIAQEEACAAKFPYSGSTNYEVLPSHSFDIPAEKIDHEMNYDDDGYNNDDEIISEADLAMIDTAVAPVSDEQEVEENATKSFFCALQDFFDGSPETTISLPNNTTPDPSSSQFEERW